MDNAPDLRTGLLGRRLGNIQQQQAGIPGQSRKPCAVIVCLRLQYRVVAHGAAAFLNQRTHIQLAGRNALGQPVNERLEQAKLTGVACGKNDPGKGKRHLQQPLLPRACLHEQGAQAGKRLLILEREAGGNRTVQIQHAEHLPILHQGNHQL